MSNVSNIQIKNVNGEIYHPESNSNIIKMNDGRVLEEYNATTTQNGFMSKEDKIAINKINNISTEIIKSLKESEINELNTQNKNVIGAINELFQLINLIALPAKK